MERGNLSDVLTVSPDLSWRIKIQMALDAAEGVNYLHSQNPIIVHRDLKSLNLLVLSFSFLLPFLSFFPSFSFSFPSPFPSFSLSFSLPPYFPFFLPISLLFSLLFPSFSLPPPFSSIYRHDLFPSLLLRFFLPLSSLFLSTYFPVAYQFFSFPFLDASTLLSLILSFPFIFCSSLPSFSLFFASLSFALIITYARLLSTNPFLSHSFPITSTLLAISGERVRINVFSTKCYLDSN